MEIFNNMETSLRKKGYHIGTFEDLFTNEEIEFLKIMLNSIIQTFKNVDNVECKTQHTGMNHRYPFYNFEETYIHPYKDIPLVDEFMKENGVSIFQRWKQLSGRAILGKRKELSELLDKVKFNIVEKCYSEFGLKKEDVDLGGQGTIAMYEKGDKQPAHYDAGSKKTIFGIIFYLTPEEDWDETKGGEFLINHTDEKLAPIFGNYIILDFVDNSISHQVLELLKDYRRYTIISFPSIKENGSEGCSKFLAYKETNKVFIT